MNKKVSLGIITILATAAILTVPSSVLQVSYAQTNQDLESSILDVHNSNRSAVGVQPLTWSNSLADGAQTWAQQIATTGKWIHDPVHTGPDCTGPCYGENIAGFFTSVSEPTGGQSKWAAEKSSYDGGHAATPRCIDHHHAARRAVITLRWSGRTHARSVVGPRPPELVVFLTAYWCVATTLRATIRGSCRMVAAAPPVDQGAAPPVDQGAAPPVDQGAAPPVDQGAAPPVDQGAAPPVDQGGAPPVDQGASSTC